MAWSRLLTVIAGLILALGLLLWFVNSLYRLYISIAFTSPWLGNIVLVLLLVLLAAVLGAIAYYGFLFLRPNSRSLPPPRVPVEKTEAARDTLEAVERQLAQVQDEIARQALQARSQELAENLSRRALQLVVFGTGSAGKTSTVNAILGRIVGAVGAPMGTTAIGETYQFQLNGLERDIYITDTPGILEAGVVGTEREQLARQLAAEADLLLFVLDNDLRQSEYAVLRSLATIGKRMIVVLNKIDQYPEEDMDQLLQQLTQRLHPLVTADDIVAIAANPRPIPTAQGDWLQPDPDIVPLLRRMVRILRTEGEDLIADNILLQSQRLTADIQQRIDGERLRQAEQIVDRFQWIGAGVVSMTPLPGVDLLATAAINAQMVVELGRVYGCEMNIDRGKELAISLAKTLVSLGVVRGAVELFALALQTNVGTFVIGRAIQGVTAAYLTRIAGKSFIAYFRQDQSWGDGGMTQVVQDQFRLNQRDEFIRAFMQQAISRVVPPLTQALGQMDASSTPAATKLVQEDGNF